MIKPKNKNKSLKSAFTNRYSMGFILQVVSDLENGIISKEECRRRYEIPGKTTILGWLRKYGKLSWTLEKEIGMKRILEQEKGKKTLTLEEEVLLLRKENRQLKVNIAVHEKLAEIAKRDLNIDLKKNYEQEALKSLEKK